MDRDEVSIDPCYRLTSHEYVEVRSGPRHVTAQTLSSAGLPAGQIRTSVSVITNRPLNFFVPASPALLLERYGEHFKQRNVLQGGSHHALSLARPASTRELSGHIDTAQAIRFCRLILGGPAYQSHARFIQLGKEISARNSGYREEIIFAGATLPSEAKRVFSPYPMIPSLMEDLVQVANEDWSQMNPVVVTGVIGFYAVMAHPFVDGNGRWSRLVAVSMSSRCGHPFPAMINAVFQNACKAEITDSLWDQACSSGLEKYLEASFAFETSFANEFKQRGLSEVADRLSIELRDAARSMRCYYDVMTELHVKQRIDTAKLRTAYGMSERACAGLLRRLEEAGDFVRVQNESLSVEGLSSAVDELVGAARTATFGGILNHAQQSD